MNPDTVRSQHRIVVLAHRATVDATTEVHRLERALVVAKRTQAQSKAYEDDVRLVEERLIASIKS